MHDLEQAEQHRLENEILMKNIKKQGSQAARNMAARKLTYFEMKHRLEELIA